MAQQSRKRGSSQNGMVDHEARTGGSKLPRLFNDIDIVLFPYIKVYSDKVVKCPLFGKSDIVFSNARVNEMIFPYLIGPSIENKNLSPEKMDRLNTAWGKLYRRNIINGIEFVDTKEIGIEDGWYNIITFSCITGSCLYTEDTWYMYEKGNNTSLLHSYKPQYCDKRWNFYRLVDELLIIKKRDDLRRNLYNRKVLELFGILINESTKDSTVVEIAQNMKTILEEHNYKEIFNKSDKKSFPYIWKLFFVMCEKEIFLPLIIFFKFMKR